MGWRIGCDLGCASYKGRRGGALVGRGAGFLYRHRNKNRGYTVETYYDSAFEYRRCRSWVLDPLEPNGSRRCRLAYWDSSTDRPASPDLTSVAEDAVLIVDGAFLLRPELCECWDLLVWPHISFDAMVARAVERDVAWAGDPRSCPSPVHGPLTKVHELYERQAGGQDRADLVVDNSLLGSLECCAPLGG